MNILTEFANKYKTDKGTVFDGQHNYTEVYFKKFNPIRLEIQKVLEIGILDGASAKMWRDFFDNATIFCLDIIPEYINKVIGEERIQPFVADQSDSRKFQKIVSAQANEFDIIIDDGSHQMDHQQMSFGVLFPLVKSGGYYVLEDLHTSLNSNYTDKFGGYQYSTLDMFKNYQDSGTWKSFVMLEPEIKYLNENVDEVEIFGWENTRNKEGMSITAIIKKK